MVELVVIGVLLVANFYVLNHFLFRYYRRRFPPFFNMVLAKATFETLPDRRRQEVREKALEIVNRTWVRRDFDDANFRDEAHRFSWYALAMAELGIPPLTNTLGDKWFFIEKPHLYPFKSNSIYEDILIRLSKESGIRVSIAFPVPQQRTSAAREEPPSAS